MSTYLLIHGAWHGAWCWHKVVARLEGLGHQVLAPDLPGLGRDTTAMDRISLPLWREFVCAVIPLALSEEFVVFDGFSGIWNRLCAALIVLTSSVCVCYAAQDQRDIVAREDAGNRLAAGEHRADLGDVTLWYRVAGNGPYLIVSSTNWGGGSGYLQHPKGIASLEKDFTLIYLNSRGTPPSTRPLDATQMSSSLMVDDIEHMRQYWGLKTLDLIGHSGGGMLVLGYAERYSTHTRKLLLLDAEVLDIFPSPRMREILDGWRTVPRYAEAVRAEEASFAPTDEGFTRYLVGILPLYFHDPENYLPVFAETLPYELDYWVYKHNSAADAVTPMLQSRQLKSVTAKTLVIVGRADFICPVEMSETISQGIPGSKLVVFERTGHMPWIEERAKFFRVVLEFLRN